MSLVSVLCSLLLERLVHISPSSVVWPRFPAFADWLGRSFGPGASATAALLAVGLPLAGAWLGLEVLGRAKLLDFLLGVAVLYLSFGDDDWRDGLQHYRDAERRGDEAAMTAAATRIVGARAVAQGTLRGLLSALLVHANDRIFAPVFWFVVGGPVTALLYRLATELEVRGPRSLRGSPVQSLHLFMEWFPARLLALFYALAGSLTHAFDRWDILATLSWRRNEQALVEAGLGAVQYADQPVPDRATRGSDAIDELEAMIARAFTIGLILLALLTLAGWT